MAITNSVIEQSVQENKLVLSYKQLKDSDILVICLFLKNNPIITSLDVSGNQIGDEGAKALATNTRLTSLNVGWNQIGDEGANALAANTSLTSLDVSVNQIGPEGAKALAANTRLTSLDVRGNRIGDEGAKALAANTRLTSLNVGWNQIGDEGANALAANRTKTGDGIYGQITNQTQNQNHASNYSRAEETSSSSTTSISMMVLGGFIAAAGIAAVAIAFTLLNAATFGIPGLVVAGIGIAATLSGVGLFATGAYKNSHNTDANESLLSNEFAIQ